VRKVNLPAIPAKVIEVPDDDPRTNAYFICEHLHVSQRGIARVAGVSVPSVNVMLKGKVSPSAKVKAATVKALRAAGFKYAEDDLFDPAMDAERLRRRELASARRRVERLEAK
jgi:hypothetical protein